MFKTSLQTITWGDPQHHLFDHIFGLAAEVGFRRLGQISIDEARTLLHTHQIGLSACHVGGNLADLTQAKNERAAVEKIVSYLVALKCDYLIYSGLNIQDDAQLETEISGLRTLAASCAERGKRVLYHNHDWEFMNNRKIWSQLLAARIDDLGFAPDLGWAVKGGQDIKALLVEIGSSVETLHFKDFLSWEDGQNTCQLGDGVVDFTPAWDWLSGQGGRDIWVTAEQDNAVDNDVACRHNGSFLASHLAGLGA